ncbi:hypothetical protein [Rothia uropygialis]|uniref:hypothetical protein n=1 Tax=Kocuria sp. 36 TaxID=1415402 RepID=UPI00101CA943|nr:hypothetical protein [Kocuria sp. 36]
MKTAKFSKIALASTLAANFGICAIEPTSALEVEPTSGNPTTNTYISSGSDDRGVYIKFAPEDQKAIAAAGTGIVGGMIGALGGGAGGIAGGAIGASIAPYFDSKIPCANRDDGKTS